MTRLFQILINHGTQGFDAKTTRRLRATNGIALIVAVLLLVQMLTMIAILASTGQTPFTFGNFMLFAVACLMLPVGLLHRASSYAGAIYLFSILLAATLATLVLMGRAMGNEFALIVLATLVPVLFGTESKWPNYFLASLMVALFLLAEAYSPIIGPIIEGRSLGVIAVQRNVVVAIIIAIVFFVVNQAFTIADKSQDALEAEHARSEALLYNLLPTEIAARLKAAPDETIADNVDKTAILFADIVGFTPRSAAMSPEALVDFLNRIFSAFDVLAAKHGLEKIKTIGDAYMVAASLPQPVDRPVHRVAEMAFDMLTAVRTLSEDLGEEIDVRIGIHTGPVVAGVIGQQKLFYDVWGDTVNTASRMESHGQDGRIQITAAVRAALTDDYRFERRGPVEIKGIGAIETWWLLGRKTAA